MEVWSLRTPNPSSQNLRMIRAPDSMAQKRRCNAAISHPPRRRTAQDVTAAQSMSSDERQAMIRGMVDRLAARLEQNPGDKEGWARLAHAYDVLGESEKAASARTRAAQIQGSGR